MRAHNWEEVRKRTEEQLRGLKAWQTFSFRIIRKNGELRHLEAHSTLETIGGRPLVVGMFLDITERFTMEKELRYFSMHDKLTGLFNRAYFEKTMKEMEDTRTSVGILVADVNGLKLINDILGHQAGDTLIKSAGRILEGTFRQKDVVARIGGDEFAVLLPKATEKILRGVTRRIERRVAQQLLLQPDIPLSLSIGYALAEAPGRKLEEIFREADDMMYRNKLQHREKSRQDILQSFTRTLEQKEFLRDGHQVRVAQLAQILGRKIGLQEEELERLWRAALYHDVGLIGIEDRILSKPGKLDAEELAEVQRHPEVGHRLAMALPELADVATVIFMHHEWWDGRGYPRGLKGEEISLSARIIGLAEAVESMDRERSYQERRSVDEICQALSQGAGGQFDPALVAVLLSIIEERGSIPFE